MTDLTQTIARIIDPAVFKRRNEDGFWDFDRAEALAKARQIIPLIEAGVRERTERVLRIYPHWCRGWGLDRNMRAATEGAIECADALAFIPETLPEDDELAGAAIAAAIRAGKEGGG